MMAFWSSALYGAAPCPLAGNYLHQLRQAANKALRCKHAARNALLRFSLSVTRWTQTLDSSIWFQFFRLFDGYVGVLLEFWIAGACGNHPLMVATHMVLLCAFGGVGWSIGIPPMVIDRLGHSHGLLLTPWMLLRHLLEDAWLCYVGSTLTRASMSCLRDIDGYVVKWGNSIH